MKLKTWLQNLDLTKSNAKNALLVRVFFILPIDMSITMGYNSYIRKIIDMR